MENQYKQALNLIINNTTDCIAATLRVSQKIVLCNTMYDYRLKLASVIELLLK